MEENSLAPPPPTEVTLFLFRRKGSFSIFCPLTAIASSPFVIADFIQRTEVTGRKGENLRPCSVWGAPRCRAGDVDQGPAGFTPVDPSLVETETRPDCSPGAWLSGRSVALFVVLKLAPRRGDSNPPTGARLPGAAGLDRWEASLETAAAHRGTASSTVWLQV